MLHSATAAEYGEWLRWYYLPVFVALVAMLLFVHYYLGTGRVWLLWTVIFARSVQVVVNFSVHPNFAFSSIDSLRSVSLFGEQVSTIGVAIPSERQWFAVASSFLLTVYLVDAAAQGMVEGEERHETQGHSGRLGHSVSVVAQRRLRAVDGVRRFAGSRVQPSVVPRRSAGDGLRTGARFHPEQT